eukprot:6114830-Pleurochrysis_carterae.AAC.5
MYSGLPPAHSDGETCPGGSDARLEGMDDACHRTQTVASVSQVEMSLRVLAAVMHALPTRRAATANKVGEREKSVGCRARPFGACASFLLKSSIFRLDCCTHESGCTGKKASV